jgi:hypothetical protein
MTNERDAEFLDGDALGKGVGDNDLPGERFPPDHSQGVEADPSDLSPEEAALHLIDFGMRPDELLG